MPRKYQDSPAPSGGLPPGRAVFANAVLIQQADGEFVLDFVMTVFYPHELVARVVVSQIGLARTVVELERELSEYEARFGLLRRGGDGTQGGARNPPRSASPARGAASADSLEPEAGNDGDMDLARDLLAEDDRLMGVFADSMTANWSPQEFCLDFHANFYPRPVVACRVYMVANRVPGLLATLRRALLLRPAPPWEAEAGPDKRL